MKTNPLNTINADSQFVNGFTPKNVVQVGVANNGDPIVVYHDEWKGRQQVHLRSLYDTRGVWNPGKGISMPADEAPAFFAAIAKLAGPKKSKNVTAEAMKDTNIPKAM